jgi:hypothetical protein
MGKSNMSETKSMTDLLDRTDFKEEAEKLHAAGRTGSFYACCTYY